LYIVAFVVCSILSFKLSFIITILYVLIALFCATKAYNGMYVEIEFLEKIIAQFQPAKIKKENKTNKEESDIHDPLK